MFYDDSYIYHHFCNLDSTNNEALFLAQNGAPSFSVVIADNQNNGRGRHGNTWISLYGNLYVSLLVRDYKNLNHIPFISAVSIGETIKNLTGVRPQYKWPNDVLVNDKKVSGILIESKYKGSTEWVVIGIGVNIISSPIGSIYLNKVSSNHISRDTFLPILLKNFSKFFNICAHMGFSSIKNLWIKNAINLQKETSIRTSTSNKYGNLIGLQDDGISIFDFNDVQTKIDSCEVFF